jgi:hypothetical protein
MELSILIPAEALTQINDSQMKTKRPGLLVRVRPRRHGQYSPRGSCESQLHRPDLMDQRIGRSPPILRRTSSGGFENHS